MPGYGKQDPPHPPLTLESSRVDPEWLLHLQPASLMVWGPESPSGHAQALPQFLWNGSGIQGWRCLEGGRIFFFLKLFSHSTSRKQALYCGDQGSD